jgi:D-glycero-D-manno-heptose 1,7-bisphosphate phosphatase
MSSRDLQIDKGWTLFLDRDGVINKKLEGEYVIDWKLFRFLHGVEEAMRKLSGKFGRIILVTNQQGIGKKIHTTEQLEEIHERMLKHIMTHGGRIDAIYFAPQLEEAMHPDRKPGTGMALRAKEDFPEIDFRKSVMAGDSVSDIEFGKSLGMRTVMISPSDQNSSGADFHFPTLLDFASALAG